MKDSGTSWEPTFPSFLRVKPHNLRASSHHFSMDFLGPKDLGQVHLEHDSCQTFRGTANDSLEKQEKTQVII